MRTNVIERREHLAQYKKRKMERSIKTEAVAFRRWTRRCGLTCADAASYLEISPSTLAGWEHRWKKNRLKIHVRGRPQERSDLETQNMVIETLHLRGPCVGLPTLKAIFPEIARRELAYLLYCYRIIYLRGNKMLAHSLRWEHPGAVWAMDYTEPPKPIDELYPQILVVRDLASGYILLALPAEGKTSQVSRDALASLLKEHTAPLVIKSDNDKAFTAEEVKKIFLDWGINFLLSPVGTPKYNGACEAGIGSLKTRAHYEAARNSRPGEWTCDDVEGARLMANQTSRPRGYLSPPPEVIWKGRLPITRKTRAVFAETVGNCQEEARKERGYPQSAELTPRTQASIDRMAIRRALVACGILSIRRRRITLPIKSLLRRKIS